MPHTAVHLPLRPGGQFAGKSGNGDFGDWVEEMDWSVGRILDTLRELGLAEKTLVVFTSNNGPWTGPVGEAHDLDADIGETTNVADAHPDVVSRLLVVIKAAAAELRTTARPAGKVDDPQMLYPAVSPEKPPRRSK